MFFIRVTKRGKLPEPLSTVVDHGNGDVSSSVTAVYASLFARVLGVLSQMHPANATV